MSTKATISLSGPIHVYEELLDNTIRIDIMSETFTLPYEAICKLTADLCKFIAKRSGVENRG